MDELMGGRPGRPIEQIKIHKARDGDAVPPSLELVR